MEKKKSENSEIIIYQTDDGRTKIDVRMGDDTVWLTQAQISELFQRDRTVITKHIRNVFDEGELNEKSNVQILHIANSDKPTTFYNLDVIISVGYRVKSLRGTQFRQWATKRLNEYIRKGFALDDERLKGNGGRYFRELLQRIRDIRSSERNLYQQVTDIYATAIDYDVKSNTAKEFFASVQNKLHFAVHGHTAAEIIHERVDSKKPQLGMTNFKSNYITKDDVGIAKNYLNEKELTVLNLLVSQFLDYAELQAIEERAMTMGDWICALEKNLKANRREILADKGKISHKQAIEKAEKEFKIFRDNEMKRLESDFDKATKKLKDKKRTIEDDGILPYE
ncbi:MAG: virulence RhuM family protein [Dehalococcoidia bacterium]|nr:virulence RhuM family protein [Dehalococcoidia bacterium]